MLPSVRLFPHLALLACTAGGALQAGQRRPPSSPAHRFTHSRPLLPSSHPLSGRRKKKNNPILLGEPGVGKTAIAEGLARAIVTRTNADGSPLPAFLWNKRVMQLDVGLLIAGAKVRGVGRRGWGGAQQLQAGWKGCGMDWTQFEVKVSLRPATSLLSSCPASAALVHWHLHLLACSPALCCPSPLPLPLQERGELELRVTKLLQECKSEGNIILMIDEVRLNNLSDHVVNDRAPGP